MDSGKNHHAPALMNEIKQVVYVICEYYISPERQVFITGHEAEHDRSNNSWVSTCQHLNLHILVQRLHSAVPAAPVMLMITGPLFIHNSTLQFLHSAPTTAAVSQWLLHNDDFTKIHYLHERFSLDQAFSHKSPTPVKSGIYNNACKLCFEYQHRELWNTSLQSKFRLRSGVNPADLWHSIYTCIY